MATDEQIQRARRHAKAMQVANSGFGHDVEAVCDEAERLREVRYLPIVCPVCGRLRLEYDPSTHECRCEKCGADNDVLRSSSERLRGRVEAAEALVRVLWDYPLSDDDTPDRQWGRIEKAAARFRNTEGEQRG